MNKSIEYLIIGAGPAGVQLGYFLAQNQRNYLILEKAGNAGAFFDIMPRHRYLISINKVYTGVDNPTTNLRWDWNSLLSDSEDLLFKNYSKDYFPDADLLSKYVMDFANHYQLNIQYDTRVTNIHKEGGRFIVTDTDGNTYTSDRLVVATGFSKSYIPDIPGMELCKTYANHSIHPEDYINQRVLIVGKGNSAFEVADHLTKTAATIHICSPHSLKFAWQTHYVGHLRAVNNNFLDTYQLKAQNAVIDATIRKVEMKDGKYQVDIAYSHAQGQVATVTYDHVILCTGFKFDASLFDESCRPELAHMDKFPAQTSAWESVNVPDLYFAGTLMQACDYRKTMSGFIHGFRHNIEALSNIFEQKYHANPWPSQTLEATPATLTQKIIERVTSDPAMFLQPGFLGDALVVSDDEKMANYYPGLRLNFIPDSMIGANEHYYTVSLEYGHFGGDPFSIERDPDPDKAGEASYLHPVIRRYNKDMLVAEHHIQDDLENAWYKEIYTRPAKAFFEMQLNN